MNQWNLWWKTNSVMYQFRIQWQQRNTDNIKWKEIRLQESKYKREMSRLWQQIIMIKITSRIVMFCSAADPPTSSIWTRDKSDGCMIDSIGWIYRHESNLNYVLLCIDVSMVWHHHTFPGCASRCPSSLVALTYARLLRVNFWFPLAKRKQLDQGHLQSPAQLGTICQSNFLIQPRVTVSQLSKWNCKHFFFLRKCWPDTDLQLLFIF